MGPTGRGHGQPALWMDRESGLRAGRGHRGSGKKQVRGWLWVTEHCPLGTGRDAVSPNTSEELEPARPVEGSGLGGGSAPGWASSLQLG